MHINSLKAIIKTAVRGAAVLLLGVGAAGAQQQINLTAAPTTATLPDGSSVPMWGYSCGAAASGSAATCAPLNPAAASAWSPVVITVPTTATGGLQINLTNNLPTPPGASTGIPTSIIIVGQIGGGLGTQRTTTKSPDHSGQGVTWPTANVGPTFPPPVQPDRVQSLATEVATGATTPLTWTSIRPGTYLFESGTHQSIQATMGLYGVLVVTNAPSGTTAGTAYPAVGSNPAVSYNSEIPLALGEIDPVQNTAVNTAVNTAGFSETKVWSGQPGGCGNPASPVGVINTCYPPVVNYTPLYYTINGVAFSRTNASASLFASSIGTAAAPVTGNVLVRLVNAGSRMHVPSIVGSTTGTTAKNGFALVAEDGNPVSFVPHVQSEIFMAAGKTFDALINVPAAGGTALPIFDRELSLSANKINRDAGMLAYIGVNGAGLPAASGLGAALANPDTYNAVIPGQTLTISNPGKGVIANDVNVYGVKVVTAPTKGTLTLNADGTFTYAANSTWATSDSFVYCGNGATSGQACATVTLGAETVESASGITCGSSAFSSNVATLIKIPNPGILANCKDAAGFPLTVVTSSITPSSGLTVVPDVAGGFTASIASTGITFPGGTYSFTFKAQNAQGTVTATTATATITFPAGSGLTVTVADGKQQTTTLNDYRWIIEEDQTFFIDPNCTTNPPTGTCPGAGGGALPLLGTNFHTSNMPFVAQGCTGPLSCETGQTMVDTGTPCTSTSPDVPAGCSPTAGQHIPAICDVGNGVCRPDPNKVPTGKAAVLPGAVALDPTKRYYISVLPGDAANPFIAGNVSPDCANYAAGATSCGHSMGGAPIGTGQKAVTVLVEQDPFPPSKLAINVFEDDFPLNGEQDAGGGVDIIAPLEPGLGGFNIVLWDDMGGSGDVTGQMTYDMFNQPLSNSLDGTLDPVSGLNACPITKQGSASLPAGTGGNGITGMIVTCPKYESDGITLSPLAGQAVVANLMPGRFSVQAIPGADRIARGENWLQTNTLDGQKAHDSFLRIGEPAYFQEFGPASYHVSIGFANPKIINSRLASVCSGNDAFLPGAGNCTNTVTGKVTTERMSRTPDERLYSSGSRDSFFFTQCYVSVGDPDGEDFAFTTCNADGTFTLSGLPAGNWRVTTFDEWNDQLVDGLSFPVGLGSSQTPQICPGPGSKTGTCDMGDLAANQWQANVYTRTFIDENKDGISQPKEGGIPFINTTVRYRDGSLSNNLVTDLTGTADFNEEFPLFNWYVVEADTTRYKTTGIHTVYDSGGPADGSASCGQAGYPACGNSTIGKYLANTNETVPLPSNLRVPGAVYCDSADCTGLSIATGPIAGGSSGPGGSTGRIDPPWVPAEGWQGYSGQNNFIEFGKTPYVPGENGGIHGHVVYASTRPFDDPQMLVQTQWEPLVPNVTINLYQEGTAADGITPTLTLVDTTQSTSWDAFAQGFRSDGIPNMNCPGQTTTDLFYFSLYNQENYLNLYAAQHGGPAAPSLPNNSQFKCYDGMHNWNQLQPAPYDGMYSFPSVTGLNPSNGKPSGTNCTICTTDPDATDPYRFGAPMLPVGKYVVEVVPPAGYEIVKEEDKNILIGDDFIAPVTQEFGGLGNIFIIPDQASVASSQQYPGPGYNQNNAQNPTQSLGANPNNGIVPGFTPEPTWPCVGDLRVVPDYISLFPQSQQVAPFAGASRRLCDRKEVTLSDQAGAIAKFYIYTSTHKAAKFTGVITDDFTSEFDPFSPQFGEKFAPPNMPIAIKDWTGTEIGRVYSDWWGDYDGLTYSTWEVNPPNPTGYSPTMMIFCMNDKGTGSTPDPLFNPAYSQFCYELPYMPGQTQYLDTPVVPTSAFSAGYNHPDCNYPAATPAIKEVDGDQAKGGPYVSAFGKTLTITGLGDQVVPNYGYSGPSATTPPFNNKTATRHYGFGGVKGTVSIGGVTVPAADITGWGDESITLTIPNTTAFTSLPVCGSSSLSNAYPASMTLAAAKAAFGQCGQLVITAANGQTSVDAVTVTIGGKAPTYVSGNTPLSPTGTGSIQQAIDEATPGDLIIVPAGNYQEMVIMWKPVRLQGVGAASSIIDANTQPAGKMDPWRRMVVCLFGLQLDGTPMTPASGSTGASPFDPTGTYQCGATGTTNWVGFKAIPGVSPQVDRLPLEGIVGWDATVNGNLAQLLNEPTLMGAYEGAAITVVAKGVRYPIGAPYLFGNGPDTGTVATEGQFPLSTRLLTNGVLGTGATAANKVTPGDDCKDFPSNFLCAPSAIDGLSLTDSSQGGGGIFSHAWGHNLQIANNRIFSNIGTLSGGINIGQGESPDALLAGNGGDPLAPTGGFDQQPWTCLPGSINNDGSDNPNPENFANNTQMPYCYNRYVNVHHNAVTSNTSIGDELFSGTPAGAGGVSFCTGADYYKFNYNWVCGNMSTGDGGGFSHVGFIYDGDIEHNSILFNQSLNPTIPTNGGGIIIMGAAPDGSGGGAPGSECGSTTDVDCAPGLPDGTGPGLVINANLIMGNAAEAGSGGGLRLQSVNGTEVGFFPRNPNSGVPRLSPGWNTVTVTNNIITNNVAGWDGGGVSLQDALAVNFINNTVVSNDSTATAGVLFNTIGAPEASAPGASNQTTSSTTSAPQPAGLVAMLNSPNLVGSLTGLRLTCPANHANCGTYSNPYLANDVFWQNRSFQVGVGALSPAYQQNIVTLYNSAFTGSGALGAALMNQPQADATTANGAGAVITGGTGACVSNSSYWDLGIRGDTGPGQPASTIGTTAIRLAPTYSMLTNASENGTGTNNLLATNPTVVSQYCNGSRIPPEFAAGTWNVPPGIADATVPNPLFNLTPAATVDEGNNWINMTWGPLAEANPVTGTTLGNYALAAGSPAIDHIPYTFYTTTLTVAPTLSADFFGNPRPDAARTAVDVGAVEYQAPANTPIGSVTGGPLAFGNVVVNTTSAAQTLTLNNTGTGALTGITLTFGSPRYARAAAGGTCGATLAAGASCTINVVFSPTATGLVSSTLTITSNVAIIGSPVTLTGTGVSAVTSATLTPTNWSPAHARNCPTPALGCALDPVQAFTLTNTGNVTLTGIGHGVLGGTSPADYLIRPLPSTCGAAGGGQLVSNLTLAPGATCVITVQFEPRTSDPINSVRSATVSVTDAAGTQTSTLTGTAQ